MLEGTVLIERACNLEPGTAGMVLVLPSGSQQVLRAIGTPAARLVISTSTPIDPTPVPVRAGAR